jgi:hypothetical protein
MEKTKEPKDVRNIFELIRKGLIQKQEKETIKSSDATRKRRETVYLMKRLML